MPHLSSFPPGATALVLGSTGGIGAAVLQVLQDDGGFAHVLGFHRHSSPALELTDEQSIASCAQSVMADGGDLRLIVNATGILQEDGLAPERSWRELSAHQLARLFAVNAIGPALVMKHFLPLLARQGKSVFATLSAKVGSIGDNRLGGWYGYRASKAALNQFVRTAAVELRRQRPDAICCALHPGTVATALSEPHAKRGLEVRSATEAAVLLVRVLDQLTPADNGLFLDYRGGPLPW